MARPSKAEEIRAKKITIETEDGETITFTDKIIKTFKMRTDNQNRVWLSTGIKNKVLVVELR
jgi:hypothetical protein